MSKQEVAKAIGQPDLKRADERVWVYAEEQTVALALGPYTLTDLGKELTLLLVFDEQDLVIDQAIYRETFRLNRHGCRTSGLCFASQWMPLESTWWGHSPWRLAAINFYHADSELSEQPGPEHCRLVLYPQRHTWRALVQLVDQLTGDVHLWWILNDPYAIGHDVPTGSYRLQLVVEDIGFDTPWGAHEMDAALDLLCVAGETHYVHYILDRPWFDPAKTERRLENVPSDKVLEEINRYTLVRAPADLGWLGIRNEVDR